jgi:15-cis-phytoene synthase
MSEVRKSYEYCRDVARSRARNFYYAFVLLPSKQRDAMCAMYAFMRYCDDLSDEPGATRAAIERWRDDLDEALKGRFTDHPVWPAFHDAVNAYGIPHHYFHEIINGVESDLDARVFQSFADLYRYCYQVASVVGMTTVHIFGFDSPQALPLAEKCGIAFQLTNILRDIREDVERGRVYLPVEDLERFGVGREDLARGNRNQRFLDLMRFETERARAYYVESKPLIGMVHARSRPSLRALISIYAGLLNRIEQSEYDVFSRRVRLSAIEKSWAVLRALAPR